MKSSAAFTLLLVFPFLLLPGAHAQDTSKPELEVLAMLAGQYEYEFTDDGITSPGVLSLEPYANGYYLRLDETMGPESDDTLGIIGIIGYDVSSGQFTWYRVFSHGAWDRGVGRLVDGDLLFDIVESYYEPFGDVSFAKPNVRSRTAWKDISDDGWTFVWEQSVDGGPWEKDSEGQNRRVSR